jgi:hypothetical protein
MWAPDPVRARGLGKAFETGVAQLTPKVELNPPRAVKGQPGVHVFICQYLMSGGRAGNARRTGKRNSSDTFSRSFNSERFLPKHHGEKRTDPSIWKFLMAKWLPQICSKSTQDKVFHPQAPPVQFLLNHRWPYFRPSAGPFTFPRLREYGPPAEPDPSTTCICGAALAMSCCFFWALSAWQVRGPHHGRKS